MNETQENRKNLFQDIPTVDLKTLELDRNIGMIISEEISLKIGGVVIGCPDEKTLILAVEDPTQIYIYDTVEYNTNNKYNVTLLKAEPLMIKLAREFIYRMPAPQQKTPWNQWLEQKKYAGQQLDLKSSGSEMMGAKPEKEVTGTVIDTANKIITEAISIGASDVHLEPYADHLDIRYRMDGVLHVMGVIRDMELARALIKRFKIMGNIDIAQESVTQGGRISVQVGEAEYDLRVSIIPTPEGQGIVMRLLNKGAFDLSLETLGFSEKQFDIWQKMISRPYGIILCCGPTGSGKSTTLFASLKEINRPDRKLLTVEDPIEYRMPGVMQVQVNMAPREMEKKVTFATALREFLRQDPDVILVGEIRDEETAGISVKAALTGHLVLSTIHTNDAVGIINRLKDMNVMPYLISSAFIGGVAQRLVRRLCPHCKKPSTVPNEFKELLAKDNITDPTFFEPVGCDKCRQTGYRGRVGLYEMLVLNREIQNRIEAGATSGDIYELARKMGMRILLEDGVAKAARGLTSASEVNRVCMMEIDM